MSKALSYNDIALIPKLGQVDSRDLCSTQTMFLGKIFALPVIPANMRCSIDFEKADWCQQNNACYVMHRFYSHDEIYDFVKKNQGGTLTSISLGVSQHDFDFATELAHSGLHIDFITIDIAHGHCIAMKNILNHLRTLSWWQNNSPKLIAGNVTTGDATADLITWGADAVKVGIGQGHVCTTRLETGFGMPMVWAIKECAQARNAFPKYVPIIADGGISQLGDAAKAMACGADMVMSGSMFARCIDSPAETEKPGMFTGTYKKWFGSASEENKGQDKYVEGKCVFEESNYLTYDQLTRKWKEALRSAISYAGGTNITALNTVDFNIV